MQRLNFSKRLRLVFVFAAPGVSVTLWFRTIPPESRYLSRGGALGRIEYGRNVINTAKCAKSGGGSLSVKYPYTQVISDTLNGLFILRQEI